MAINRGYPEGRGRQVLFFLFSALLSVAVFTYLFVNVSPAEVVQLLKGITPRWFVLFLLFSFAMSLFRTWRYQIVLNASGYRPDNVPLFLITIVRNFFSDLLPARLGTLIYIYLVQTRLGIPFGAAASSFAYAFIFDMVSLALLIILAIVIQSSDFISPAVMAGGAVVLGLGSFGVLMGLPFLLRAAARFCLKLAVLSRKLRQRLHDAIAGVEQDLRLIRRQGIFWRVFALSLGVRCSKYLSLYVLLLALVLPLGYGMQSFPLARVFLGLCSAELAASLPISGIAGFGAYEGTWTLVFQLLGYPERIAALTGISHHLLTQVHGYSLGALALLLLLLPLFRKKTPAASADKAVPGRLFWIRLAATALGILALAFVLLPDLDRTAADPAGAGGGAGSDAAGAPAKSHLDRLSGKIVYQRPDGIYVLDLGENKPRRIAPYGSYPRWSPDGRRIAFVHDNAIMTVMADGGKMRKVAAAQQARAVCFAPDGRSILFSDGNHVRRVDLDSLAVSEVLRDGEFREIGIAGNGGKLAATIRIRFGYRVRVFDLQNGTDRTVAGGCSASLSPGGELVTVLGGDHEKLFFHRWDNLQRSGYVSAPAGMKFDNQYWSNHQQWIISTSEGAHHDIYVHHVPSDTAYRVTTSGDCDRGDLYVTDFLP
jgi:uncharacterized protein (TIRG00374 family)